jgi:hypothetical protein
VRVNREVGDEPCTPEVAYKGTSGTRADWWPNMQYVICNIYVCLPS